MNNDASAGTESAQDDESAYTRRFAIEIVVSIVDQLEIDGVDSLIEAATKIEEYINGQGVKARAN